MRRLFASFAFALLAIGGIIGLNPVRADASPCNIPAVTNPSTGHVFNTLSYTPAFTGHSTCFNVWVVGQVGSYYIFQGRVQDTIDPSGSFDEGRVTLQWRTPGTSPWVDLVWDKNSADWNSNQSLNGAVWTSPNLHHVFNGAPNTFQFRLRVTTVAANGQATINFSNSYTFNP